jgi:hypothetical protein
MVIAIPSDAIADTMQREQFVLEWLERSHDPFKVELVPFFIRPKVRRDDAVRAEDNDHPLAGWGREPWCYARQVHQEREGGGSDS